MTTYNILLIEDNLGDVDLIKFYLSEINDKQFNIEHVASINKAMEILANTFFDLILSDLNLPDSKGLDTVSSVSQATKDLPLIFLTGLDDEAIGLSAIQSGAQDYLIKEDLSTRLLDKSIKYAIERNKSKVLIEAMAIRDELTGLYNRAGLKLLLKKMSEVAKRHKKDLGIVLIDIDKFKDINDMYGHFEGDKALQAMGEILLNTFRNSDIIARYGGDEFVSFFLCDHVCGKEEIKKRLNENIEEFNLAHEDSWKLSISIGVNKYSHSELLEFDEMIRTVDHLMYKDKMNKKNE